MFGYYGSSTGLSATFPGIATASKIALNTYRIDIHCTMLVNSAPEDYFTYGIYASSICQKILGKLPTYTMSGQCTIYNSDGTLASDIIGYGAMLLYQDHYCLSIGRYYQSSGTYGSWSLSKFVDKTYTLDGFFFVQI